MVWAPAAPEPGLQAARAPGLPIAHSARHLRRVELELASHRQRRASVIDGQAAAVVAALAEACRELEFEPARRQIDRLIGWGEGLTPAGDDFLVGLLAGLDASVEGDSRRPGFRAALAAAIVTALPRTTDIAAHCLRLACGGHYSQALLRLRQAVLDDAEGLSLDAALQRALAIGATSGADGVSGLLAGLRAWSMPAPSTTMAV